MVEFQLDFFENNPLEAHRNADGHVQFTNTGDELIDKWEEQIARGETPNMSSDMFDEDTLAKIERLRVRGNARTESSFKSVYDEVERDAQRQGLVIPDRASPRLHRSSFGDGTSR